MKKIGVILEYGLGDAIVSMHLINYWFNLYPGKEYQRAIFQISFRNEWIKDLLTICKSFLPEHKIITEGNSQFNSRYLIMNKYRDYDIKFLNYVRSANIYRKDLELLTKNKFDFKRIVPTSQYTNTIQNPFALYSVDVLGADRLISAEYWKAKEQEWFSKGITPVLIGKQPTNAVDIIKRKTNSIRSEFVPSDKTLDLREKTTMEDLFWLIRNCELCEFPANGLSVLAYELGKKCKVFGTENNVGYEFRFFPVPYDGFELVFAKDYQ
jgi:hypothetical protein